MGKSVEIYLPSLDNLIKILEDKIGKDWPAKYNIDIRPYSDNVNKFKIVATELDEVSVENTIDVNTLTDMLQDLIVKDKDSNIQTSEKPEKKKDEPSVYISVSEDNMVASIALVPNVDGEIPSKEDILKALNDKDIVYGIDELKIKDILGKNDILSSEIVAVGKAAIKSKDDKLDILFPKSGIIKTEVDENKKVSFRDLYKIYQCQRGSILAKLEIGKDGEEGVDVFGNKIPSKPRKKIILNNYVGDGVIISEDGTSILANIDGQPYLSKDGKINVREVFFVNGDLTYEIGNINFNGSVVVTGNVEGKFNINSGKDINIEGIVGPSVLNAEGDIIIRGGISGRYKAKIMAKGSLITKFINEANVICEGNVIVGSYIMNSSIISKRNVIANGKGLAVGGQIIASGSVKIGTAGNNTSTLTTIRAGVDFDIFKERQEIADKIKESFTKLSYINSNIKKIKSSISFEKDKDKSLKLLGRLSRMRNILLNNIKSLDKKLLSLNIMNAKNELIKDAKIVIRNHCYENVNLFIGNKFIRVDNKLGPSLILIDKHKNTISIKKLKDCNSNHN